MIALLVTHLRYAIYLVAIVLGLAIYHEHNLRIAEEALAKHEIALLQTRDKVLADSAKQTRAIVTRDTIKLTKVVREYKTIHDTALMHLTDTVLVKEAFAKADTTIRACRVTVQDCTALNHILTLQLGVKDSEVVTLKKLLPSTTATVLNTAKWLTVGAAAGYFLVHFGVVR